MGYMGNHSIRRTKTEQLAGVHHTGKPKKVANNTVEYVRPDGTKVIRLHLTDIVEFLPDGSVRLDSGGFRTVTTKDRLNQYVPQGWSIWSEKGTWYVARHRWHVDKDATRYVFCDGITFHPDGTVTGSNPDEEQKNKELGKKINKFCKALAALPKLPKQEAGDCWFCLMQTTNGQSLGDAFKNTDHLESHLDEMYFVGSMILQAMQWAGCSEFVIGMAYSDKDDLQKNFRDYAVRAVRRYLRARLGLSR